MHHLHNHSVISLVAKAFRRLHAYSAARIDRHRRFEHLVVPAALELDRRVSLARAVLCMRACVIARRTESSITRKLAMIRMARVFAAWRARLTRVHRMRAVWAHLDRRQHANALGKHWLAWSQLCVAQRLRRRSLQLAGTLSDSRGMGCFSV
jgi:hypothetical protein